MKILPNNPCPCNSGKKYKKCCRPFHEGVNPKSALELMRSRYCAFKLQKSLYIIKTTHKENNDYSNNIATWEKEIIHFSANTEFRALEIIEEINGEYESYVSFKVSLFQGEKDISFCEKSRFLKENDKWLYVDGEFK